MIADELKKLALDLALDTAARSHLRLAFGMACIDRVAYLLTESEVIAALATGKAYLAGCAAPERLREAADAAAAAARSHAGSNSLDGAGNAAVSTSFGVAAALAGRALEAAGYAAYASVYAYSSSTVTDVTAYRAEHAWQVARLRELAQRDAGA